MAGRPAGFCRAAGSEGPDHVGRDAVGSRNRSSGLFAGFRSSFTTWVVGIDHGGLHGGVSEVVLDLADVDAVEQQVGREAHPGTIRRATSSGPCHPFRSGRTSGPGRSPDPSPAARSIRTAAARRRRSVRPSAWASRASRRVAPRSPAGSTRRAGVCRAWREPSGRGLRVQGPALRGKGTGWRSRPGSVCWRRREHARRGGRRSREHRRRRRAAGADSAARTGSQGSGAPSRCSSPRCDRSSAWRGGAVAATRARRAA